jgi:hypothetical protein
MTSEKTECRPDWPGGFVSGDGMLLSVLGIVVLLLAEVSRPRFSLRLAGSNSG